MPNFQDFYLYLNLHVIRRQCTFNVILRSVCAATVAVEKQWVSHILCVCVCVCVCVCSLNYPACNAQAPYNFVICDLSGSTIFFHIISQTTQFSKKKLLNTKCVFWFSLNLLPETFLILRRTQWGIIIKHPSVRVKYPLFFSALMRLEFFRQIFENTQISSFMKIRPHGTELFHVHRQRRHDGANSSFSQFCGSA